MASAPTTDTPNHEPSTTRCGARTRGGTPCKLVAGKGTDHVGFGHCKLHGGRTPNGIKHAATLQADAEIATIAARRELSPHDALLDCVYSAAGAVAYYRAEAAKLEQDALLVDTTKSRRATGDGTSYVERTSRQELHPWLREYQDGLDRLARFSKMAIDAGVAERHVRIAEQHGQVIATLLERVLSDLRLTAEQQGRAPEVVRRHLTLLEGGATEAAA